MKGMMLQENVTLDEALKKMEEGQMNKDGLAMPPRVIGRPIQPLKLYYFIISHLYLFLVVSSSSGTENQDFDYTSSSEDMVRPLQTPSGILCLAKCRCNVHR